MGEYLSSYWRRRSYNRLGTATSHRSKRRQRWSGWRIRITPKLKLKLRYFNPNKFLIKLHDGYVRMMMRVANSRVVTSGAISTAGYGLNGISPFGMRPTKEYDEKMIIHMYKSLIGQTPHQLIS